MKNNTQPEDSGGPWNTDDLVYQDMTCKELAKFSTSFITCLRLANEIKEKSGNAGIIQLITTVLGTQQALLAEPYLVDSEREIVNRNCILAIQAACMAGIFSSGKADPRHLAAMAVATTEVIKELEVNAGPLGMDDAILIKIRMNGSSEDNLQIGAQIMPVSELAGSLVEDNIGKAIKKIVGKAIANPMPDANSLMNN